MSPITGSSTPPQRTTPALAPIRVTAGPSPASVPAMPTKAPEAPSATVTLSEKAQNAMNAGSHPVPAAPPHEGSVYESLKNGIETAATDVGDAISGGAHAVADGVGATLSAANTLAHGILDFPFAAVSKACDAAGRVIDAV